MSDAPVRDVVIVGGGTAGWMTATYLKAAFGDTVEITVVESARVPTVGVGEATFSTIRRFFNYLGLVEEEWMPRCSGTYKLGIRFENWREPGHHFYHPFERLRVVEGFPLAEWWLHLRGSGHRFDDDCFVLSAVCEDMRSPRTAEGALFETTSLLDQPVYRTTLSEQSTQFPYAYHFDASLLAGFLAEHGVAAGVHHVVDDVVDVEVDERGWITHVRTRERGLVPGDLFVDCSGFRGLLINDALGEPFESFAGYLPNDRAVALRAPVDAAVEGIRPATTATAMDAGWIWTIPLRERVGTGYVYSSEYCTADEAEATLREFVGESSAGLEANHLKMRIGRCERSWVNNCVAIGLASGFVEPLESTGIFFIQHGVEQLAKHFPFDRWDPQLVSSYNRAVGRAIDGIKEFLVLHYYGAARADNEYWRDAKTRSLPPGFAERIDEWRTCLPDVENVYPHYHGYEPYSWTTMLVGLGGVPLQPRPALARLDPGPALQEFDRVREARARMVAELPSHYDYINRGEAKVTGG